MFLNNFRGAYGTNWQSPFIGQNTFGNTLGYGQNVVGTQIPFGQNVFGTQIPFGQNAFGAQLPYLWNQTPFTSHLGGVPCYYTMGNVMGQFLPQTLGQPISAVNAGFAGIPFANTGLGYGINNTIGHGFSPVAGIQNLQNLLGCC